MPATLNILVIKRGAIGDLLLATPLLRQLKLLLPCRLSIVVGKSAASAVRDNPYLDQQYVLADKDFTLSGVWQLCSALLKLRGRYDYVFILDKHWYFNLISFLCGGIRVGFWRDNLARVLLAKSVHYHDVERYHGLYYLDLLAASGLAAPNYADLKLDLTITSEQLQQVMQKQEQYGLNKYVVVVNSGGNNSYESGGIRMLPEDKILGLLQRLLASGCRVVLIGGVVDKSNYLSYAKQLGYPQNLLNVAGQLSLSESCWFMKMAKHVYTTDCGAMHLAVLACAPQQLTAFFGPTNPAHILPHEYVLNSAIWFDRGIYARNYQLSGKSRQVEPLYFSQIDMAKLKII